MHNNDHESRKAKLTPQQIEYCLVHAIRDPDLFAYCKQHLKPFHFSSATETPFVLLWSAVLSAAKRNDGKLPEKGQETVVAMELVSLIDNDRNTSQDDAKNAESLFQWIYSIEDKDLNPVYYRELIQELIIERTIVSELTKEVVSFRDNSKPLDIIRSLDKYHHRLQTILIDPNQVGASAFPKNYKPKKLGKFSTGFDWVDKFMNGGQAGGEVYAVLGPSGVGKTTTAVMITTATARIWNSAYHQGSIKRPKISCLFSWEQDQERLRHKFWSYAAQIDATRVEMYADELIVLSTKGNPVEYEIQDFADVIKAEGLDSFDCESERLAAATEELHEIVKIFDFSGAADNPRIGEGGLDEVSATLRALTKAGWEIGVVVLDYAKLAVQRMMAARGEDISNIRHHLANFCNDCRFKIAIPFNCPVWALHQLNTESNKRSPTAMQHHSSASECGNFAENAWFGFVFGTKDKVNNLCYLHCTKERRARGDRPPVILKIVGNYSRLDDVSEQYIALPDMKKFELKSIANRNIRTISQDLKDRINKNKGLYGGLQDM